MKFGQYIHHVVTVTGPTSVSCDASLPTTVPSLHGIVKCPPNVVIQLLLEHCEFRYTTLLACGFLHTI